MKFRNGSAAALRFHRSYTVRPPVINKDVWRKDRSVLRVLMRWMPAKQLAKLWGLGHDLCLLLCPKPILAKFHLSTLLKFPTEFYALCKVAKLRSYETFAGETEQPWVHPIHCTMNRSQCLLIQGIQPWDFWWTWAPWIFCSCGTSFVIVIIDIHQEQPGSLVAGPAFCWRKQLQLFKNYVSD